MRRRKHSDPARLCLRACSPFFRDVAGGERTELLHSLAVFQPHLPGRLQVPAVALGGNTVLFTGEFLSQYFDDLPKLLGLKSLDWEAEAAKALQQSAADLQKYSIARMPVLVLSSFANGLLRVLHFSFARFFPFDPLKCL